MQSSPIGERTTSANTKAKQKKKQLTQTPQHEAYTEQEKSSR